MFTITVTVTNAKERAEAEYRRDHIDMFMHDFNGASIEIEDGDEPSIRVPVAYENEPSVIRMFREIFTEGDET